MSTAEAADLEADYRFLSRLEDRLRIESDQAAWALPTAREQLTPIARRMGYTEIERGGAVAAGTGAPPLAYTSDLRQLLRARDERRSAPSKNPA